MDRQKVVAPWRQEEGECALEEELGEEGRRAESGSAELPLQPSRAGWQPETGTRRYIRQSCVFSAQERARQAARLAGKPETDKVRTWGRKVPGRDPPQESPPTATAAVLCRGP